MWIEDKRLSLVVHARRADDPQAALAAVHEPVAALGDELGLEVHPGSGVLELRLPGYDKAGALATLAEGRAAVLFLGDDLGDLPAFEQIRAIRADGAPAWGVGVLSSGAEAIAEAADVTVDDPAAIVDLLQALADRRAAAPARQPSASSWPWNQATGGSRTAAARIRPARSRRSSPSIVSAWCSASAVLVTSNGFTCSASSPSTSATPVSREITTAGDAFGQHQPLEHDQVHPVAHRVHEHDVAAAHDGQRLRVVLADVEHQWRPLLGAELVVDLLGQPLDAGGVLAVGRQVLARGIVEHRVDHAPAPLGSVVGHDNSALWRCRFPLEQRRFTSVVLAHVAAHQSGTRDSNSPRHTASKRTYDRGAPNPLSRQPPKSR